MEIEPFLNTREIRQLQLEKLKVQVKRIYANSPFHQRRLKKNGVTLDSIEKWKSLEDFSRDVPIYDKSTMRDHAKELDGNLIKLIESEAAAPLDQLVLINSTTGTTGAPSPYPFSRHDVVDVWGEVLSRGCWRSGVRQNDRILHCFALSMVIAGTASVIGLALNLGATVIPVGAERGTDAIFSMIDHFKPTVLMGTPSLGQYLIEKAHKTTKKPVSKMNIKRLLLGGEPGAGIPEVKSKLEKSFCAKVFDFGAGLGFSCDYPEYQGMHWLADDLCLLELVDPHNREPIPLEDGARGEAVMTMLDTDCWTFLRNSPGDIFEVSTSPCPCGQSGLRYKVVGRTDSMLKVKGVMIYPAQIEGYLQNFIPRVTGEFRIVLTEKPPLVIPPLKIRIEFGVDFPSKRLPELEKELLGGFHSKLKIKPEIIWQKPGGLERSTYKGVKIEKCYEEP
jgi:phenylacetate-CoA ligase